MPKNPFPGVPVLLGGVYASLIPEHARANSGADEVVIGPGGELPCRRAVPVNRSRAPRSQRLRQITIHARAGSDDACTFSPCPDLAGMPRSGAPIAHQKCLFRGISGGIPAISPTKSSAPGWAYGFSDVALYDDAFLVDAGNHALPFLKLIGERVPGLAVALSQWIARVRNYR